MNIILTGPMASGKNTLAKYLEENYGIERIKTVTTRPKRPGEADDEYIFLSQDQFDELAEADKFAEKYTYDASFGKCSYGSLIESYQHYSDMFDEDKLIILDTSGIVQLTYRVDDIVHKEISFKEGFLVVRLDTPDYICSLRAAKRGDDEKEIIRRIRTDKDKFTNFDKLSTIAVFNQYLDEDEYGYATRSNPSLCWDLWLEGEMSLPTMAGKIMSMLYKKKAWLLDKYMDVFHSIL